MRLELVNSWLVIAKEDLKDDAYEMWGYCDFENKYKAAVSAFYAKKGIKKDDEYVYLEFIDEKGNTSCLNCSRLMHEMMLKFKLYPAVIQNTFLCKN